MSRSLQSVLLVLMGVVLIAVTVSGRFTSYVRPGFGPLLIVAGAVLVLGGLASGSLSLRREWRRSQAADAHEHAHVGVGMHDADERSLDEPEDADERQSVDVEVDAHGHSSSSRASWLVLAPILVLLLAPPALGADAVTRESGSQAIAGAAVVQVVSGDGGYVPNYGSGNAPGGGTAGGLTFPPLPAGANPPLALKATVQRALYDASGSVSNHPVTVIGFLAPAGTGFGDGYSVARLALSCCAADANPYRLHVEGAAPYPDNTWVQAVVTAVPGSGSAANNYVPTVNVASMTRIAQPADPYEH